jgi:hypothetical protein
VAVGRPAGLARHPRPPRAALGIELDHARFHDDPPTSEAPGGIPLPCGAVLGEGQLDAPTARALKRPLPFPAEAPMRLGLPPALRTAASTCFTKGWQRASRGFSAATADPQPSGPQRSGGWRAERSYCCARNGRSPGEEDRERAIAGRGPGNAATASWRQIRQSKGRSGHLSQCSPWQTADGPRRIGFKTADIIAMKLGVEETAMVRVRAGISYALRLKAHLVLWCL